MGEDVAHGQGLADNRRTSGFGRELTEAALAAGDTVVAAVREPAALDELVTARSPRTGSAC